MLLEVSGGVLGGFIGASRGWLEISGGVLGGFIGASRGCCWKSQGVYLEVL